MSNKSILIKKYLMDVYHTHWGRKVLEYGYSAYHARMLEIITSSVEPKSGYLLEVGVGTGWPFACKLLEKGYIIYGGDLVEGLVREARVVLGNSRSIVLDAENLPLVDESFELVYCLQSSWLFPDLNKAISEMVRVTRRGGIIIIDVMNWASFLIIRAKIPRRVFGMLRSIKRWIRQQPPISFYDWERPTTHWNMKNILRSLPVDWRLWLPENAEKSLNKGYFHPRLLYILKKY